MVERFGTTVDEDTWRYGVRVGKGIRKEGSNMTRKQAEAKLRQVIMAMMFEEMRESFPVEFNTHKIGEYTYLSGEVTVRSGNFSLKEEYEKMKKIMGAP